MEATEIKDLDSYLLFAESNPTEWQHLVHAVTIHTTFWFRELDTLLGLAKALESRNSNPQRITGIVMACSTGQEVYSLAMILAERWPNTPVHLIGVDIDTISVETARKAIYDVKDLEKIPLKYRKMVRVGRGPTLGLFTLDPDILKSCSFVVSEARTMALEVRNVDFVTCRNMLIYFNSNAIQRILIQLKMHLASDGFLALGVSESIQPPDQEVKFLQPGLFQKIDFTLPKVDHLGKLGAGQPIRRVPALVCDSQLNTQAITLPGIEWDLLPNDSTNETHLLQAIEATKVLVCFGPPDLNSLWLQSFARTAKKYLLVVSGNTSAFDQVNKNSSTLASKMEWFGPNESLALASRICSILDSESTHKSTVLRSSRILIVDDDPELAELASAFLSGDGHICVAVESPLRALELLKTEKFDLLVADYSMPEINGSILINQALKIAPRMAVILVSGALGPHHSVSLPSSTIRLGKPYSSQLLKDTARRALGTFLSTFDEALVRSSRPQIIAIGSSTGGPQALNYVLNGLAEIPVPIIIVQHISETFHNAFYEEIARYTSQPVRFVDSKIELTGGAIYAPKCGTHMELTQVDGRFYAFPTSNNPVHGHRPAVDPLFYSIAEKIRASTLAILMTGMGRDGALGLKALKDAGHTTIIQDEASCVVYGMPKVAAELQAATMSANLDEIRKLLHHIVPSMSKRAS